MSKQEEKIEIYKDEELLKLTGQMRKLEVEETGFLLFSEIKTNEKGRTMKDVAKDMADVYMRTNTHLINKYPRNRVAESWIAVNELSSNLMIERWVSEDDTGKVTFCEPADINRIDVSLEKMSIIK